MQEDLWGAQTPESQLNFNTGKTHITFIWVVPNSCPFHRKKEQNFWCLGKDWVNRILTWEKEGEKTKEKI